MAKKFENINNGQNKIDSDLNKKNQKLEILWNDKHDWKDYTILNETEWITIAPSISSSDKTTVQNQLVPQSVNFNETFDINLPTRYLPFIQANILVKTPDEVEMVGVLEYNRETFEGDYVEVYGNGTLIYKGTPYQLNHVFTQADLDAGKFDVDYTKNVYRGIITYTQGGFDYMVDGTLSSIELFELISVSPYGNLNFDIWTIDYNPNYLSSKNYAKFSSLTSSGFTGHAMKTEIRWLPIVPTPPSPPYEYQQNTFFDDIVITKTFASAYKTLYRITQGTQWKKIAGNWVFQGTGDYVINSSTQPILTKVFEFTGYWLFWDDSTSYMVGVRDVIPLTFEGSYHKIELYNLPQDPFRNWTSILLKRNPSPHPEVSSLATLAKGEKQNALINLFPNDDNPDKFRMNVKGKILLQSQATEAETRQYPVYYDNYVQSGLSYVAIENHTLKNVYYYSGQSYDIQYKLQLVLINPYDFSDRQNYEL